ncbi:LiaF transmembrane domain-containing protein [Streptococcus plurextorum]|uniref:LiaF transmembrane domain-containing protein n=1 Tax=Streptococcus plurextorum TaxID=456876 RepID=UPI0003F9947B|nr:hypothetical protein [Streptococcus plurextorum]
MKRLILGLLMLLVAGVLLFQEHLGGHRLDLPLWVLICSLIFVTGFFANAMKRDWVGAFGSLAILAIILNAYYDWLAIGTGSLVMALILAVLGFQLLFKIEGRK